MVQLTLLRTWCSRAMASVYFYVPNIIGYLRVLTLLAGMSVALDPAYPHFGMYLTKD